MFYLIEQTVAYHIGTSREHRPYPRPLFTQQAHSSVEPQVETDMIPAVILMILYLSTDIQAQSGSPPVEGPFRVVNGTSCCAGRAEVFFFGHWRTVCGSDWALKDANIV
ncbi:hypothetical protein J4Q44_G00030910 [Coregonus suidteri]|uniref:SRCR domain-containing protein n=1 Tax=Coregonus suidteri TaxID=861788 RepID=A0AAN8MI51_9TELE